jgi:hypothetical protein
MTSPLKPFPRHSWLKRYKKSAKMRGSRVRSHKVLRVQNSDAAAAAFNHNTARGPCRVSVTLDERPGFEFGRSRKASRFDRRCKGVGGGMGGDRVNCMENLVL